MSSFSAVLVHRFGTLLGGLWISVCHFRCSVFLNRFEYYIYHLVCLFLVPISTFAQDDSGEKLAGSLNRMASSMPLVLNAAEQADSKLELVEEQKSKLAKLKDAYLKMIQEINRLDDVEGDDDAATNHFLKTVTGLENTLHNEVLLPHQSDVLESMVFAKFVKDNGGNTLQAIAKYYADEFKLDKTQKKKMLEIEERVAQQGAAAQEKLQKELEQIANDARRDALVVLTPKQKKTLERFQD